MKCGSCGRTIDDEFILCPFCGADVGVETPDEARAHPVHPDVYPLLVRANLLKTRGDLAGAREKCAEALRKRPNDFDAQMMLGELYEAEGNSAQALTWYQMALDVRPDAPDVYSRMEALKSGLLRGEQETAVEEEEAAADVAPQPNGFRIRATVIVAGVTVVLLALVIGAGALLKGSGANRPDAGSRPSDMPIVTNVRPQGPADPAVSAANAPSGGAAEGVGEAEPNPTLDGYTADERALRDGIGPHPGFSVSAVAIDPRTAAVTIRLATPISQDAQAERARIGQTASDVALRVLSREPGCAMVSIEVLVRPSGTSASSLGFVGEMRRGQNVFVAPWFGPALGGS